jgi:hypothetical protein
MEVKMRRVGFLGVVLAFVLLAGPGCTDEQLARIDKGVADANTAAQGVAEIAEGPAGGLIPDQVKIIMQLLGVGAAVAFGLWQKIRASGILLKNADLVTTIRAVVDGIDASGAAAEDVKVAIKNVMEKRHVYDTADAVVDENRSAKTTV